MEYKLNRIDTDIRKKIEEDRNTSRVHEGKNINVNKDLNDKNEKKHINYDKEQNKQKQKRYITIDGIKYSGSEVKVEAEKQENINVQNSRGRILDIKK